MSKTLAGIFMSVVMALGFTQPAQASTSSASTYIIGDSITVRGTFPYLHDMRPGWYIDGVGGRPVSDLPDRFEFMRDRLGFLDNIVIALGTNPSEGWTKRSYGALIRQVPKDKNVFLVTTYRGPKWGGEAMVAGYARWMRQIARNRDNVYLIDWRKQVIKGRVRLADGIHAERGTGEQFWAKLINRRVTQVSDR